MKKSAFDALRRLGLTPKQIRVLTMYAASGLTLTEISRACGIPDKIRVHRIIKRANERIREQGLAEIKRKIRYVDAVPISAVRRGEKRIEDHRG